MFIKNDMERNIYATSSKVKAPVSFVTRWVTEKDTFGRERGEFIG
jgi:hypothetical protein